MEKAIMMQNWNCPNCSTPLDFTEKPGSSINCPYCHTLLVQAEDSFVKPPETAAVAGSRGNTQPTSQAEIDHRVEFIREMALAGNKIVAVKALGDIFRIDKIQAQELVDAMARGELVDTSLLPPAAQASKTSTALDPILMQELLSLIRKGEKIEAIKMFRQETGVGLKDARDVIDLLHANLSALPAGSLAQIDLDLL
jgi:ribosomal protein L7/L12